jgi:hypothetical protein
MVRQISSRLTFFYKFILPGVFVIAIIGIGSEYFTRWESSGRSETIWMTIWPVGLMIVSIVFLLRINKVYVDEKNLYVSDYRIDATIPVSNIARVSEFFFSEPRRITIHFKQPTAFGRKVVFLAPYRFGPLTGLTSHPLVAELRELIASS